MTLTELEDRLTEIRRIASASGQKPGSYLVEILSSDPEGLISIALKSVKVDHRRNTITLRTWS